MSTYNEPNNSVQHCSDVPRYLRPRVRSLKAGDDTLEVVMRSSWIALGFGALASSAMAADLPRKAPPVSPVQSVQAANWTGLYVGVHGGYSWGRWNGDLTFDPGVVQSRSSTRPIERSMAMAGSREGRLDSTISSTPLSSELKRMRRGQTSKGAEVSIQLPATSTGRLKIDWIGSGPSAAERASR